MKKILLFFFVLSLLGLGAYFVNPGLFKRINEIISPKQLAMPAPERETTEEKRSFGSNMEDCIFCHSGKVKCSVCAGSGAAGKEKCKNCSGTGLVNCSFCGGTGRVKRKPGKISGGVFGKTQTGSSKGKTTFGGLNKNQYALPGDFINCKRCKGTGYISEPVKISQKITTAAKQGSDSYASGNDKKKNVKDIICPDCKGQGLVMVPYKK